MRWSSSARCSSAQTSAARMLGSSTCNRAFHSRDGNRRARRELALRAARTSRRDAREPPAPRRLLEALRGVLADRLEHREAARLPADEALVDERLRASSRSASHTASAASSVQPPAKTASRAKSCCSFGVEQLVAPLDRRAQRAAGARARRARRRSGAASRRSSRARSCVRREHLRPAPPRARSRAAGRRGGGRSRRAAVVGSKPARAPRARARRARPPSSSASGGTGYSRSPARRSGSRLVTSSARLGQPASSSASSRRGLDHLLEVVEQRAACCVRATCSARSPLAPSVCAIVGSDELRVAQRCQRRPTRRRRANSLDELAAAAWTRARLPDAARAGQRHAAALRRRSSATHLGELASPARRAASAARGRFVRSRLRSGGKSSVAELEEPLGLGQVLEPVLARGRAADVAVERARVSPPRGAPGRRARPRQMRAARCTSMPDVALGRQLRLAGVDAHADADRPVASAALSLLGRGERRPTRVANATKKASPCVSTSTPPWRRERARAARAGARRAPPRTPRRARGAAASSPRCR